MHNTLHKLNQKSLHGIKLKQWEERVNKTLLQQRALNIQHNKRNLLLHRVTDKATSTYNNREISRKREGSS